jgi:hypothetical protein
VEVAMRTAAGPYAAGTPVPMVRLSETLYAGCLPALMLGALMINLGSPRLTPRGVRAVGAVGMVALGFAGPLVDGLHHIALWPLYLGGVLACIWIVWAGAGKALRPGTVTAPATADGRRLSGPAPDGLVRPSSPAH